MKDTNRELSEQISSAIDGELSNEYFRQLFSEVVENNDLIQQWSNYNLIGHVIRNGTQASISPELWLNVRKQLESEPVIMVPLPVHPNTHVINWSQKFVSYALAASLLVLALNVGQSFLEKSSRVAGPQIATTSDRPHSLPSTMSDSRFDDYLLVHNESTQIAGTGAMLPYARLVSAKSPSY